MTSTIAQKQPSLDYVFILEGCMKGGLSMELHSKDFKGTSALAWRLSKLWYFQEPGRGQSNDSSCNVPGSSFIFLRNCAFTTGGKCVINYQQHEIWTSAANIRGGKVREEEQLKLPWDAKPLLNAYQSSSGIPNGVRKPSLCTPHDRAGHNNSWLESLLLSKTKKVLKTPAVQTNKCFFSIALYSVSPLNTWVIWHHIRSLHGSN